MCLDTERPSSKKSMIGYAVVYKELDKKGEPYYRPICKNKHLHFKIGERKQAYYFNVRWGGTEERQIVTRSGAQYMNSGGFYGYLHFKDVQNCHWTTKQWGEADRAIVKCEFEHVIAEGYQDLAPAFRSKYRTILEEVAVIEVERRPGKIHSAR